jgi:3-methyladenine DNA glycosylase AlkC
MAEPLKNMYNPAFFEMLCPMMKETIPGFNCSQFIVRIFNNEWPELELKKRVRHITTFLHDFLSGNFAQDAAMLVKLSQALKEKGIQGFATIFLPDYIEVYGIEHPEESLSAIEEITKLVSAEFAIRPFIVRYPDQVMKQMLTWSTNKNKDVRRLSSEGCRPRLPWSMALPNFKKDPNKILPILENLKNDESEYVRRSVANNLNDIAKDHPDLILKIAKRWQGKNENTNRIIKHACRTLLKRGNQQALSIHGFDSAKKATIKSLTLDKTKIKIGDRLEFAFDFICKEKKGSDFRLEYAIDFITSTGKTSRKIFQITEKKFDPQNAVKILRKQSFKNLTTRKHFKGKHQLAILANGKELASASFTLI